MTAAPQKPIKDQTQHLRLTKTHDSVSRFWASDFDPLIELTTIATDPSVKPADRIAALKVITSLVYAKTPTESQVEIATEAPTNPAAQRARLTELLTKAGLAQSTITAATGEENKNDI